MTEELSDWEFVFRDSPLPDALDHSVVDAEWIGFYAKYPAELADTLAKDYRTFMECSWPLEMNVVFFDSPIVGMGCPHDFWRLFRALQPNCPIDPAPFQRLHDAVQQEDREQITRALTSVRYAIRFLFMWLEASDLWTHRPTKTEATLRE